MSDGLGPEPGLLAVSPHVTLVINPAVGCHYFLPGPRLPSQLKSIVTPWPVLNYTAWWQRDTGVSCLPKPTTQWCPDRTRTRDLWITSPRPYTTSPPHQPTLLTMEAKTSQVISRKQRIRLQTRDQYKTVRTCQSSRRQCLQLCSHNIGQAKWLPNRHFSFCWATWLRDPRSKSCRSASTEYGCCKFIRSISTGLIIISNRHHPNSSWRLILRHRQSIRKKKWQQKIEKDGQLQSTNKRGIP